MCLSISTNSIPGSLREKLEAIAEAGFSGVELHDPDLTGFTGSPTEVRSITEDLGLGLNMLQPFHDLEGHAGSSRRRVFDRLEHKFDLMQELGTDLLLVTSSTSGATGDGMGSAVDDLSEACERAEARSLRLAYLGLPWAGTVPTDLEALQVIEAVNRPGLGLAVNAVFSLADGSKPARLRDIPGDRLFHVQLSDAPRLESDTRRLRGQLALLPGLGVLNLAGLVRVLVRCGYQGPWSVGPAGHDTPRPGGRTMARDGYRAIVNLLDEVGRTVPGADFGLPALPERVYASGFEFIEFAVNDTSRDELACLLASMCFRKERTHVSKSVELWRQGAINIVINSDKDGFAHEAFLGHGPSVCDMGLRVQDAAQTVNRATALRVPHFSQPVGVGELDIPAIRGVGGSIVHFIDEQSDLHRVWDIEFEPVSDASTTPPAGLRRIDHLAQTMRHDEMQSWLLYYMSTFEMAKSRMVDVVDPSGVVHSQAIESPEGEVRLNLNGAVGQRTFAASFLQERIGAGVQHIAFLTDDIFETSDRLAKSGFPRLAIPENYYADLQAKFGLDDDLVARLRACQILHDRSGDSGYFQIYSQPVFDGFFFEIVQRQTGYSGFGAHNAPIRLAAQMQQHHRHGVSAG